MQCISALRTNRLKIKETKFNILSKSPGYLTNSTLFCTHEFIFHTKSKCSDNNLNFNKILTKFWKKKTISMSSAPNSTLFFTQFEFIFHTKSKYINNNLNINKIFKKILTKIPISMSSAALDTHLERGLIIRLPISSCRCLTYHKQHIKSPVTVFLLKHFSRK